MKEKMWIAAVSLALLLTGGAFFAAAESGTVAVAPDKAANGLTVTENGVSWTQMDFLNIFNNPAYNGEKIVVPGQAGQYTFTVENHTAYILDYDVAVSEINRWELPMVCRLRSEKGYTGGEEWVSPEMLTVRAGQLPAGGKETYTLEWQWLSVSDEQDTLLGAGEDVQYTIRLDITAEQNGPAPATGGPEPPLLAAVTAGLTAAVCLLLFRRKRRRE